MKHTEMIMVIEAHSEGKAIQVAYSDHGGWVDASEPSFNFDSCKYRVKPEPEYIVIDHIHSIAAADAGRFVSINALEDMWVLVQLKSSEWDVEHMHMAAKLELLVK